MRQLLKTSCKKKNNDVQRKREKNACHKNREKLNTWHTTETEKNQIHGITRNREKFNT